MIIYMYLEDGREERCELSEDQKHIVVRCDFQVGDGNPPKYRSWRLGDNAELTLYKLVSTDTKRRLNVSRSTRITTYKRIRLGTEKRIYHDHGNIMTIKQYFHEVSHVLASAIVVHRDVPSRTEYRLANTEVGLIDGQFGLRKCRYHLTIWPTISAAH
jgi:hypothetical protein